MEQQEKRGAGRPSKSEEELMVRVNVTLPLAIARELRQRVPEKQRSKLIARLLQEHFKDVQSSHVEC